MNMTDLKKLQSVQLEIMDEVHRICAEHQITYYIVGGTALGAVRHGGFIPWDLDIDVAMPRADYERFAQIAPTSLANRYIYRDYKNTHNFMHPHALICVRNTFLSTKYDSLNSREENVGIYLDIFPIDVIPDEPVLCRKHLMDIERVKRIKYLRRGYLYSKQPLKNAAKKMVAALLFFYKIDKLNAKFDRVCQYYENTESSLRCLTSGRYGCFKEIMPAAIFGTPQLVKFEDRMYFAPEQLEEYLTRIYKDYMTLPPEEERQANLNYFDKVILDK